MFEEIEVAVDLSDFHNSLNKERYKNSDVNLLSTVVLGDNVAFVVCVGVLILLVAGFSFEYYVQSM